jgi:hypothetical protein
MDRWWIGKREPMFEEILFDMFESVYGVRLWHGRLTPIAKGVKQFLGVESKKAPSPPLPDATLGFFLT